MTTLEVAERVEELLAAAVPKAASLVERREAEWLESVDDREAETIVATRWDQWVAQTARGDEDVFADLLVRRHIDPSLARVGLAPVGLVAGAALPDWADALRGLLSAAVSEPRPDDVALARSLLAAWSPNPFLVDDGQVGGSRGQATVALAGFVPWARRALRQTLPSGSGSTPVSLEDHLLSWFMRRVLDVSFHCLRMCGGDTFAPDRAPLDGWTEVLTRFPAVARVLGMTAVHWRAFSVELLDRLTCDMPGLRSLIGGDGDGPLPVPVGCDAAAGEVHDGGRSVTVVHFDNGSRLYYKPKDLRLGDALADLVHALGVDLTLPVRWSRDGYVWEVPVDTRRPADAAAWARLARQVGMWASLFDVLGSSDMMAENTVVAGDRLVPIDTETILPLLFGPSERAPRTPVAAASGLLTFPLLTRAQAFATDHGLLGARANAPLLDHIADMATGLTEMHRTLVEHRGTCSSALERWSDLPVRALVRNTWVYDRLLTDSLRGDALVDGVQRDLVIERLWRAQLRFGLAEQMVDAEVAALRDLDIPLFRFLAGGQDLIGPGGRTTHDALHEPSLVGVFERLDALPAHPDPADLDALGTLAFCAAPGHRPEDHDDGDASGGDRADRAEPAEARWLAEWRTAGRELLDLLQQGGPGNGRLEAGLAYVAHNDRFVLARSRPPDLLSGSAGIALVLAELSRADGPDVDDPDDLDTALLDEAARQAHNTVVGLGWLLDDLARWRSSGVDRPHLGLHWGLPAALYAVCSLPPELTGEGGTEALERTTEILEDLDPQQAWSDGQLVPPAGLLLALDTWAVMPRRDGAVGDVLRPLRERLAEHLAQHWSTDRPARRTAGILTPVLPSDHGAAALAHCRHARSVGGAIPAPVAAWRDDGCPEEPGDRLVLASLGRTAVEADGGDAAAPRDPATSLECLARMEEAVLLARATGDGRALDGATRHGRVLLDRRRRHRRWFPEALAADRYRLSAIWGIGAVVNGLAGLAAPERSRSLCLLEPLRALPYDS